MSDERSRADDGTTADTFSAVPGENPHDSARYNPGAAQPVAFCQDCGRALTAETLRPVGRAIFCEPCLEGRLAGTSAAGAANVPVGAAEIPMDAANVSTGPIPDAASAGSQPGSRGAIPAPLPPMAGEPRPVLAALLGLIPGVGAMYNGQFAKGIIHLIIFAILLSLSDNVNGIFSLFVAGWVFYQAFEAYHTAVARRDFLPLPNAFGFNDLGERMGFGVSRAVAPGASPGWVPPASGRRWQPTAAQAAAGSSQPAAGSAQPTAGATWGGYAAPAASRDWVGYVPPTAFAQAGARSQSGTPAAGPIGYAQPSSQAAAGTEYPHTPYAETFVGGVPPNFAANPYTAAVVPPSTPRFPSGALWLIALGLLVLLANILPDWRISERWLPPILFAGLALWLFTRRMHTGARLAGIIRWPALLMVLAVLFALHALYIVVTFGTMCAVLLIALGALLMLERTLGAGPFPVQGPFTAQSTGPFAAGGFVPSGPLQTGPLQTDPVQTGPMQTSFTTAGPASGTSIAADDAVEGR